MSSYSVRKILVPIDLSETSLNALDTAANIARQHNAQIDLISVRDNSFQFYQNDDSFYALTADSENAADILHALAGTIHHKYAIKPKVTIKEGHVSSLIIEHSIRHHCDLIVIGTHGASGYRDGFLGSNAYHIVKNSSCPVLSVPPFSKANQAGFRRVLFPIRPTTGALQRYDIACHFLRSNAVLNVLGLGYRSADGDTKLLENLVDEIRYNLEAGKVQPKLNWGEGYGIADDVLHFSMQEKNDLIIISSALDITNKPQFIGPYTQKILNTSKLPILTIKKLGVPALA